MPRQNSPANEHDEGWLITPRALTSVATVIGLVYTLHAPVRYVLHVGATVDALTARVAMLEVEVEHQRASSPGASMAPPERVVEEEGSAINSAAPSPAHRVTKRPAGLATPRSRQPFF